MTEEGDPLGWVARVFRGETRGWPLVAIRTCGSALLTMVGVKILWPNDRISGVEKAVIIANVRIDSTNLVMKRHQDSIVVLRQDRAILDRANLAFLCDVFPVKRQQDLQIADKCLTVRGHQ